MKPTILHASVWSVHVPSHKVLLSITYPPMSRQWAADMCSDKGKVIVGVRVLVLASEDVDNMKNMYHFLQNKKYIARTKEKKRKEKKRKEKKKETKKLTRPKCDSNSAYIP